MALENTLNLSDVLIAHARTWPTHEATVDHAGELRLTYVELNDRVASLASAFIRGGVKQSDRVLWLGQNSFRVLEALLACARIGAIFCPVNWRQSAAEMAFIIDDLEPQLVISQQTEIGEAVAEARSLASYQCDTWLRHDVLDSDADSYESFLQSGRQSADVKRGNVTEIPVVNSDALVLILYTSGFGGVPCGATFSQQAILYQNISYAHYRGVHASTIYLSVGPLFHVATLIEMMATFYMAGKNVFTPRSDPEEICRLVVQEKCNSTFILGPVIEQIIAVNTLEAESSQCAEVPVWKYDLSSLCLLPFSAEWDAMITVDDSPWGQLPYGYGQTESLGYITYSQLQYGGVGAMGRGAPLVDILILDNEGREVRSGEVGEIAVRGGSVMASYWRRPEENEARRVKGYHLTKDLGRQEADGTLSFIGPKGRLIRSCQENIYPIEVEICLMTHPAIIDVAVIGVPDDKWDQSVKGVIVLDDQKEPVSERDIIAYCKTKIASYKKPKSIAFVTEIPRVNGSIDYGALDIDFGGGGYPGVGS